MAEDKKEQHPNQISLEGCVFRKIDNKAKVCKERSIGTDMIISFDYMESILSPFVSGALLLSDSKDFINTFPIEGGEEVELAIKHSFNKDAQRYKFRIYKIASRIIDGKKQVYNLLLVSELLFKARDLTFKTISVTSSLTPLIEVNSCKTPSIWIAVTAAPLIEDNKILLKEFPRVNP